MVDQYTSGQLVDVFRLVVKQSTAMWRMQIGRSFSPAQFYILEKLNTSGPQKVNDLAAALQITAGAITGRSDKLIEEGYAIRCRAEDDRRVVYLSITDKGKSKLDAISKQWEAIVERFFHGFTEEQIIQQIKFHEQILVNLKGFGLCIDANDA
jgi:DNA-binding MarR family transcriptional regulator